MTKAASYYYARDLPFRLGAGQPEVRADQVARLVAGLREAAEAGDAEALYLLGIAHFRGEGAPLDHARARQLQRAAAAKGLAAAQFELSLLLAQGVGGPADARGARRWEQRAADAGHPRACFNRAARLARARRPDVAEVVRWYARAADGGYAEAAARLCKMHLAGGDEAAARGWHARAAALGWDWSAETGAPG